VTGKTKTKTKFRPDSHRLFVVISVVARSSYFHIIISAITAGFIINTCSTISNILMPSSQGGKRGETNRCPGPTVAVTSRSLPTQRSVVIGIIIIVVVVVVKFLLRLLQKRLLCALQRPFATKWTEEMIYFLIRALTKTRLLLDKNRLGTCL